MWNLEHQYHLMLNTLTESYNRVFEMRMQTAEECRDRIDWNAVDEHIGTMRNIDAQRTQEEA
jgi:hypothetical protein